MRKHTWISVCFYLGAAYDGLLGLAFFFFPLAGFDLFGVPHPNHIGYVQFPAALLVVFAVMFIAIARNPEANRNLIPYGILLKSAYCTVVFMHWFTDGIPNMWKGFAVADVVWGAAFIWAYAAIDKRKTVE